MSWHEQRDTDDRGRRYKVFATVRPSDNAPMVGFEVHAGPEPDAKCIFFGQVTHDGRTAEDAMNAAWTACREMMRFLDGGSTH